MNGEGKEPGGLFGDIWEHVPLIVTLHLDQIPKTYQTNSRHRDIFSFLTGLLSAVLLCKELSAGIFYFYLPA